MKCLDFLQFYYQIINLKMTDFSYRLTYTTIAQNLASNAINPYKFNVKQGETTRQVSFLLRHQNPMTTKQINSVSRLQFKCKICTDRYHKLHNLSGMSGQIFFPDDVCESIDNLDHHYQHYLNYNKVSKSIAKNSDICEIVFLRNSSLFGWSPFEGEFCHWHINVRDEDLTDASFTEKDLKLIEQLILRYISQGQLVRLVNRALTQTSRSFKILESILEDVTYGSTFLPATRWLLSIVEDIEKMNKKSCTEFSLRDMYNFLVQKLLEAPYNSDMFSGAVSYYAQTGAQLVDLLEMARSAEQMRTLCETRLSPLNYQRPTESASVGQIENAMKYLGDFTNTLMTIDESIQLVPDTVVIAPPRTADISSSSSGFAKQLANLKPRVDHTFADRCMQYDENREIENIKSVTDLMNFVSSHGAKVEVQDGNVVYLVNTTLAQDKISVPFFWAFSRASVSTIGMKLGSWTEVTHIIPVWKSLAGTRYKFVVFVIKNAQPNIVGNCCFPEFLSSEYSRVCRSAFEGLNTTTKIAIPKTTDKFALGIGISSINEQNETHKLKLRVNGVEITLNKLF